MGVCPFGRHLRWRSNFSGRTACPGAACHQAVTPKPLLVLEAWDSTAWQRGRSCSSTDIAPCRRRICSSSPRAPRGDVMMRSLVLSIVVAGGIALAGCGLQAAPPAKPVHHSDRTASTSQPAAPPVATVQPSSPPAAVLQLPQLSEIDMQGALAGWALMSNGHVLRTADGGKEWRDVSPPAVQSAGQSQVQVRAAFAGMNHAFLFIGREESGDFVSSISVYATADGGRAWTTATLPMPTWQMVDGFQVRFAGDGIGYVLLHQGAAGFSEAVTLLRTTDGGAHWSVAAQGGPTAHYSVIFGGDKSGFGFIDPQHGWITGVWPGSTILLYATSDDGTTWRRQTLSVPKGFTVLGGGAESLPPAFFGASTGVMPVLFQSGGGQMVFYQTTDGGADWLPTAPVPIGYQPAPWSFADPADGFVLDGTTLYRTTDGGAQWTAMHSNVSLQGATKLDFVNASTGWALANGGLLATADGGQTWTQIPLNVAATLVPTHD